MSVAVGEQLSHTADFESRLGVSFGIQLDKLNPVIRNSGEKGNVMLFRHGMVNGDIILVLGDFRVYEMLRILSLGLGRRQSYSAAADYGFADSPNHVSADRTDIKFAFCHVGGLVSVAYILAAEQLDHGNIQSLRKRFKQTYVRKPLARFP